MSALARMFLASDRFLQHGMLVLFRIEHVCLACFHGVWLGVLSREEMYQAGQKTYGRGKGSYTKPDWNRKGLFDWEEEAVSKYFSSCRSILVAAGGGGREVFALRKKGYEADGFDCNPRLVETAQRFFRKEGMPARYSLAQPDRCPESGKIYDGLIVGWGGYTHMQGRDRRIAFLREMRSQCRNGSPILVSFFSVAHTSRLELKVTYLTARAVRAILCREQIVFGDSLNLNGYAHYFTREEIASELADGGFRLVHYSEEGNPHAIGIAA